MDKARVKKFKPLVLLALGVILIGFWLYDGCSSENGGVVELDASGSIRQAAERHLKESDAEIRRFVEKKHRTVTVRKGTPLEVVRFLVVTSDGSGKVDPDLSNLDHVEIEVRAVWDGWFHKGGETIVAYRLHREKGGKLRATEFEELRTKP